MLLCRPGAPASRSRPLPLPAQALLGFVNFKLYHTLELSYPPTLDRCVAVLPSLAALR